MKRVDYTGHRFGRLIVLEMILVRGSDAKAKCQCDCGGVKVVLAYNLKGGNTTSCGCVAREASVEKGRLLGTTYSGVNITHGHSKSRGEDGTYVSWQDAKKRCYNPKNKRFLDYGARGITMCDEWKNSFPSFLRDMGEKPEGMTLERKDVNLGYEPGNCVWATRHEQARNTRANVATWEIVRAIRLEHVNGASMMALASKYNMSHSNVCMIVHHKTWREGT